MVYRYDPKMPIHALVRGMIEHANTGACTDWPKPDSHWTDYMTQSFAEHWGYGLRLSFLRDISEKPWSYSLGVSCIGNMSDEDYWTYSWDLLNQFFGRDIHRLWVRQPLDNEGLAFRQYAYALPVNKYWDGINARPSAPWQKISEVFDMPQMINASRTV